MKRDRSVTLSSGVTKRVDHYNQYKEPHFICEIHYGPDSDKYIREYQQMKAASFRDVLETFNRTELLYLKKMLEEYRKHLN